ncbi:ABC transporter ATP-binding protein [Desulfatiglans anilini]|mgnify:CR=1 FL=1|uniref:ABC transporter ATP-binding protein n=1 Tax=Desulfatiglans anilini TaxID=90728 RepID=UPI0003FF987F|nr:ABC transporter ATP-binding protein [Desulfatiglans anilini]
MLVLEDIHTYYDQSHILRGLSMDIRENEAVTLLGRNGAGKTTTCKSIMGMVPPRSGKVILKGEDITGLPPHRIAKRGVGFVPEERRIFPSLTVLENLSLPLWGRGQEGWTAERVYEAFPVLKARSRHAGSKLSGGEQQMLAIARILRARMEIILLDEPTEGLAPILVRSIASIIEEIKKSGITILLIEQNTRFATQVADRHCILYGGEIVYTDSNDAFRQAHDVQKRYLGV